MILGSCPYCSGNIEIRDKVISGRKVKLYACTNNHVKTESDGEFWEPTEDSTCSFKVFQNSLGKWGHWISYKEMRELLENGSIEVELVSKKYGKKIMYIKHVVLDEEHGVSVIWNS